MRPRNKFEKRAVELNAALSEDIALQDYEWAKQMTYKSDVDMGYQHYVYFTIYTNIAEFEVSRLYRIYRFTDKSTDHFFCMEIMRVFSDGTRKAYFSKRRFGFGCSYYDSFTYGSEIDLRDNVKNYAGNMISYLMDYSIGSHYESDGERMKCETRDIKELARVICNNPVAETLYKNKDNMFLYLMYRTNIPKICRAYTLAKRHNFVFDEYSTPLWMDMIESIIYCKKDHHNPVFIAPKDLIATHDKFVDMAHRLRLKNAEKKRRRAEELRIQRETEQIKSQLEKDQSMNEAYIKRRKKFYDMVLTDGLIECRVLRDVQAFADEALAMDHCVFRCKYFNKPYSLILSARIDDQRVETVEVDLSNYTIKQCYGKHDQFTMHHKRIVDLVNSQMDTIKEYNKKRSTNKMKIAV